MRYTSGVVTSGTSPVTAGCAKYAAMVSSLASAATITPFMVPWERIRRVIARVSTPWMHCILFLIK